MKFLTRRVSLQSSYPNFQKKFCLAKNGGYFEFSNFLQKLQNLLQMLIISKTVLDRVISTKKFSHRVSFHSSHSNFQKIVVLQKMTAILNFLQKLQNTKMLISQNRARQTDFNEIFDPQGISAE